MLGLANAAFSLDPSRKVSQYVYDSWGEAKGFAGGAIYAIGQSADGYLWIGTERDLVRFDGANFTLIQRPLPDAPPVGPVRGFISDSDRKLWIRLEGARMLLYHEGKFEDPYRLFDLQGMIVTASALDDQSRVLFTGLGDRTFRYDHQQLQTLLPAEQSPGTVMSLAGTRDKSIWLGTRENGLFRLQRGEIAGVAPGFVKSAINCLAPSGNGGLWIGTDDGLYLLEVGAKKPVSLPALKGLQILAMAKDHDNNLWVGTKHGLVRVTSFGAVSLELVDQRAVHEVRAIFEDRDGDIWFGGSQGLERLRNGMVTSYSVADGLPSAGGGPIYIDSKSRIWFAPFAGGVFLVTDGRAKRVTLAGLSRDVVYSITGCGNRIWIGRQHEGLTALTEVTHSFSARTYKTTDGLEQNSVYAVHCGKDGAVWAGTVSSGVSRLLGGRFKNHSSTNGLPSNAVNAIAESFDRTIWVATPDGLASYSDARWKTYTAQDGLPSSVVKSVFEDESHTLWIATSGGLAYFSDGKITVPGNLPELLREQVFGIAEDSWGFLWFTTADHVLRVNRERLISGSLLETDIQSFGAEDGLKGREVVSRNNTVVADHTGRIWLSLSSGLSMANPNVTIKTFYPVAARIEAISAGGKPLSPAAPIEIPPGIHAVTLNYGSTNLSSPERIRFRYKLDGAGQDWSNVVASRQVVFSNLGPGSYVARFVASNGIGLWNGPETSVPFVIEPAFWQRWSFRILCFGLLLTALWTTYVLRIRHLTAMFQIRHQERLSEREDIARDLHDTFFQAVQSLFLRLHTASRRLPEEHSVRRALEEVLNESDGVMTEGREMFLDIPQRETRERDFAETIAGYCAEFASAHPIEYAVRVDGEPRSLDPLVTAEFGKIAREAIYNAFRHSMAKAIEVELIYGKREMRLRVRDNGQGFEPGLFDANPGHRHLGLHNMRSRARKLDANFRLWSRLGIGTELEVILDGQRAYRTRNKPWSFFGSSHSKDETAGSRGRIE